MVLEKTLESPLDCKEIKPVHPKGNQSWIFIGRTDAEAETIILWLPDVMSQLFGKDPDAGKDWRQEESRGDRRWDGWMASRTQWTWVWANLERWWRTWRPAYCSSWGCKELDKTAWLNNNNNAFLKYLLPFCRFYLHFLSSVFKEKYLILMKSDIFKSIFFFDTLCFLFLSKKSLPHCLW